MKHTILGFGCLLLMGLSWQVGAYDERDLKKLLETNECEKCDLSGADLEGANLIETNLRDADLNRTMLEGANLTKANLEGANLTEANVSGANLEGASLEGANLTGANLKGANLRGVRLLLRMDADASLSPSRFAPFSDLTKVNLTG